ncbi:MAG TPA: NAD(P)/FAD-dependent oxidoreductase [Candidatus Eisenbacteria bacterium]|nr:NAD(P)/FAD-dependent oxidoreductase [Candidatus Eisenbacteria bacterium]
MSKPDVDVAIIGGGPAGSSMAAYLAKAGVKCTVFEGELFPRPHVGESLVPSSTRVFSDLDFLKTMEARKFPHKWGAAWTATGVKIYDVDWEDLKEDRNGQPLPEKNGNETEAIIRFEERDQPGVNQNYTYHVDRGEFDNELLHHAHRLGASVAEGVLVRQVDFQNGEFPKLHYSVGGKDMSSTARLVVDASGRKTFLGKQLKLRVKDPVFDQYAIHTWFRGYDRKVWAKYDAQVDYIFIHFLPEANTWLWQIPITDDVTSIGVVTQRQHFAKTAKSREELFWETVATRPDLAETLRRAEQVRPFTAEGDYSYAMKQICGDGWLMVGDAGRFVDPIFSTGVSIALNSSRFAHKDILAALEKGDVSKQAFQNFETTIRHGTSNWYKFISVYYRLNVLFTYFIIDPRYRLDVLKLLQGDVYDEGEPPVLERMRDMVREVEKNERHIWHKLLNDMTADAFKPLF